MKKPPKRVLLVEGNTDLHVVAHLWKSHGLPERYFEITKCESDKKVLTRLKVLLSAAEEARPKKLGIILDADMQPASDRWNAIKGRLTTEEYSSYANYVPPDQLEVDGTILQGEGQYPDIGIWIMPDNLSKGMLEDFLAQLAPEDAMGFAKGCVTDAKSKGFSSFKDVHRSKAEIHTYLAWQDEPGNPLGISIDAKALDAHLPVAKQFVEFLKKLFLQ